MSKELLKVEGVREIRLDPWELSQFVKWSNKNDEKGLAARGVIFNRGYETYEMDQRLYNLLRNNCGPVEDLEYRYEHMVDNFVDRNQLLELLKRRSDLSGMIPTGIVTVDGLNKKIDGTIVGVSLVPWLTSGYKCLSSLPKDKYLLLLKYFRELLDDVKCLADNEVAHKYIFEAPNMRNSLPTFNIIHDGQDAVITGLHGPSISVGKEFNAQEAKAMYSNFASLINYYNRANGLEVVHHEDDDMTEAKLAEMIDSFEEQTKCR